MGDQRSPRTVGPAESSRREAIALLERHLPMLRAYLAYLLRSRADADDVAQDVCLTVLDQPSVLLRGADVGSYLRGIARHLASRVHRRARRDSLFEGLVSAYWDEGTAPDVVERQSEALERCLASLNRRHRELLELRYQQGLTSLQIATRVSVSAEAVRMALTRARQSLQRCVTQRLANAGRLGGGM